MILSNKQRRHFADLYRIPVPVIEHFDYYIREYFRSFPNNYSLELKFYKNLVTEGKEPRDIHRRAFDRITEQIKESDTYQRFQEFDFKKFPTVKINKQSQYEPGRAYRSYDIEAANHKTLHSFAEAAPNWGVFFDDFLEEEEFLYRSKRFRQIVYGHLNCGRNVKIQQRLTTHIYNSLDEEERDKVMFLSSDEIVLPFDFDIAEKLERAKKQFGELSGLNVDALNYQQSYFSISHHNVGQKEPVKVRSIYRPDLFNNLDSPCNKHLFCVDKNRFWLYYHKLILDVDSRDERNYLFTNNEMTARWVS